MKPKPFTWKQRAESLKVDWDMHKIQIEDLEKKVSTLRIERDAAEKRYQEMVVKAGFAEQAPINIKHGYDTRIPKEITVEKEVLPFWVAVMYVTLCLGFLIWIVVTSLVIKRLQEPILEPYPVSVNLIDHFAESRADKYSKDLDICQDAWREDERTIRKLRKGSP